MRRCSGRFARTPWRTLAPTTLGESTSSSKLVFGPCGEEMRCGWQKSRGRGSYVCNCPRKRSAPAGAHCTIDSQLADEYICEAVLLAYDERAAATTVEARER